MNIYLCILVNFLVLISKCRGKVCYFCIGPTEECGDVTKNDNTMNCDADHHTCASYLIHIEEVESSKALIIRVCDDLDDCANLDTSPYGTGTCQCLREGCEGEKCNNAPYSEQDIIDKADIGIQCLLQSEKQGAQIVALFGEEGEETVVPVIEKKVMQLPPDPQKVVPGESLGGQMVPGGQVAVKSPQIQPGKLSVNAFIGGNEMAFHVPENAPKKGDDTPTAIFSPATTDQTTEDGGGGGGGGKTQNTTHKIAPPCFYILIFFLFLTL